MNWQVIGLIVVASIVSAGGIGGIVVGIVKFSAERIAERLESKYQLKVDKELEKYKSNLENKIYISKAKFDEEFAVYRKLSKAYFALAKDVGEMIPYGFYEEPADEKLRKEVNNEKYKRAAESVVAAQDALFENAPFIPKDFFNKYDEIRQLGNVQLSVFSLRWNVLYIADDKEKEHLSIDDRKRSKEIREKLEILNSEIREYLSKLDVLE